MRVIGVVGGGVRVGGFVEFVEIVPALFVAVTVMLIALTRLEQNLSRNRSPAKARAASWQAAAAGAVRAATPTGCATPAQAPPPAAQVPGNPSSIDA